MKTYVYAPIPAGFASLGPAGRLVWFSLCYFVNWDKRPLQCFPSHATLARVFQVSERTIQRGLQELDEAGFLVRQMRGPKSAIYTLRFATEAELSPPKNDSLPYMNNIRGNNISGKRAPRPSTAETTAERLRRNPLFQKGGFFDQ